MKVQTWNVLLEDNKTTENILLFLWPIQFESLNVIGKHKETVKVNNIVYMWVN